MAVKSFEKKTEELLAAEAADDNELSGIQEREIEMGLIFTSRGKENIASAQFFWVTAAVVCLSHISFYFFLLLFCF